MLHRTCLACGWIVLIASTAAAGNPTPQSNMWRRIGFGHGPGYHAYNACPPCAQAPGHHGLQGGMNYYGGYYVPGAYPGPQAGWFSQSLASSEWSEPAAYGSTAPSLEDGVWSDEVVSPTESGETVPTPAPSAKPRETGKSATTPPPAKLPSAPKAKQPPVKPAPEKPSPEPADEPAAPAADEAADFDEGQDEQAWAEAFSLADENEADSLGETTLPIEVEGHDGLADEPAGALLPE